jgi:dCTP deaminase
MSKTGVLPSQDIRKLMEATCIKDILEAHINPASLDLPLSDEAYRLVSIFLPKKGERVRDLIKEVRGKLCDLAAPLEVGVPYLIRIAGSFNLPQSAYGYANPKSSTGRINLFCRVVADGVPMYDHLPHGYKGEMWVMVRADSFPVILSSGQALCQLRFFDGQTFLSPLEMDMALQQHGILFHPGKERFADEEIHRHADSLFLSLGVKRGLIGWECRGTNEPLDYGKKYHYRSEDFFTPLHMERDYVVLHKGSFYILTTYEHVMVPPTFSAELRATDPRFGEFRAHAAGYIDPGWGYGETGEAFGRPITLEVTAHEHMRVSHRQAIVRIRYERMRETPENHYDNAATQSNYTTQPMARLSKHFIQD